MSVKVCDKLLPMQPSQHLNCLLAIVFFVLLGVEASHLASRIGAHGLRLHQLLDRLLLAVADGRLAASAQPSVTSPWSILPNDDPPCHT